MNTTASTSTATEITETTETTGRTVRPARRIRTMLAAALIGLLAFSGLSLAGASPASAATSVTFCFKYQDGSKYINQPVFLYSTNSVGTLQSLVRSGRTNSLGCGTFANTPSGGYLRVQARLVYGDYKVGQAVYEGKTNYISNPGAGGANLSTATVYLRSCSPGLYDNICRWL